MFGEAGGDKTLTLRPLKREDCWTEETPLSYDVLIAPTFLPQSVRTLASISRMHHSDTGPWQLRKRHTAFYGNLVKEEVIKG